MELKALRDLITGVPIGGGTFRLGGTSRGDLRRLNFIRIELSPAVIGFLISPLR